MNANRFRLIFDKRTGMLIPVAEITPGAKKARAGQSDHSGVVLVPKWNSLCVAVALVTAGFGVPSLGRAQVVPDGTTNTTMTQTLNGNTMVDIANPNAAGLSHNRFTEFNVDASGLVVNNSLVDAQTTTGGMAMKNPHLTTSARAVLAEITGTNTSKLQGAIEVAGATADLIVANPNGLYVNGLSVINSRNLTLTTGTPDAQGRFFNVHGGQVDVAGKVSTSGLDHFDVVARSILLNGEVSGGDTETRLAAGLNTFDAQNRELSTRATSGANAPAFAIQGTEAGFMHGRFVTLVSTESGLGVRHEGRLTSTADIRIESDGNLRLRGMESGGSLYLKGQHISLGGQGDTFEMPSGKSHHWMNVSAAGDLDLAGIWDVARAEFNVAGAFRSNRADLAATLRAGNTLGTIKVDADTVAIDGGTMSASDNLSMTARTMDVAGVPQITAHHATYNVAESMRNRDGTLSVYYYARYLQVEPTVRAGQFKSTVTFTVKYD